MLLTSPEYLATGMHQYAVKKYSDTFPVIKYLNIYHFVFPSIVPTAHGEVYSIQHYVMKFVRLAAGRCFSPATLVSTTNKTDRHDITEILLKVALNTIHQPNQSFSTNEKCYFILQVF